MHHLNGGRSVPTFVPPRVYQKGYRGRPTLNADLLANAALNLRRGTDSLDIVLVAEDAARMGGWDLCETAFLEASPRLEEAVAKLVAAGADEILVLANYRFEFAHGVLTVVSGHGCFFGFGLLGRSRPYHDPLSFCRTLRILPILVRFLALKISRATLLP